MDKSSNGNNGVSDNAVKWVCKSCKSGSFDPTGKQVSCAQGNIDHCLNTNTD